MAIQVARDFEEFFASCNRHNVQYLIHIITTIDGVSFEDAWSRRVESHYGNQPVHFISKDDLIANKRASGRKQDLLDLDSLTGA